MVEITFLGAARSVTGSMHLVQVNGRRILLECGLFQGHRQEAFQRNRELPFKASEIDVMVLSHAHIDHSGNIPNLVRSGFNGPIFCTFATRDLCSLMLRDSAHIMVSDVDYLNEKREKDGLPALQPIYTPEDAIASLHHFQAIDYHRPTTIAPGVQLSFYDSGHILGSALCVLDISENGRKYRLLFTGDLGRKGMLILRDPEVVDKVDYLITESTYGTRLHGSPEQAEQELGRIVRETFSRKGILVIPAFSVGRTQEVVYALHRLELKNQVPHQPVYVDSPMSINATEIFRLHPEIYDAETTSFMDDNDDPFGFNQLHYVRKAEESKAIDQLTKPVIIISASGMCESGRILHHLIHTIEDPRNTILFVGYQAEDTLGAKILAKTERVPILGEEYQLKAHVEEIDGFSAHADHNELVSYIERSDHRLQRIFIVHGEADASLGLQASLVQLGLTQAAVPQAGDTITI